MEDDQSWEPTQLAIHLGWSRRIQYADIGLLRLVMYDLCWNGECFMAEKIGFIGLGNIGKPIADNISRGSYVMSVYDIAGTRERAPAGAFVSSSVTEVSENSTIIFFVYRVFLRYKML